MEHNKKWDIIISPESGWLDLNLAEIWEYRNLIGMFVKRDFIAQYKQTILGPIWFIIQPVLTTLTFMVIFGGIAGMSTDGQPQLLFYMSGILLWNYFAACLTKVSETFIGNANVFGKVYFPRLTVPVSIVFSNMITFFIQLILFVLIYLYYYIQSGTLHPNLYLLLFPYLLVLMGSLGLGFGIIISSLTIKYRDLRYLITFGVQLLMYATPVVYPLSTVSEKYRFWLLCNPITSIIETFRFSLLGSGTFQWDYLLYSSLMALFVLLSGGYLFNKVEKNFMDTV